MAIYRREAIELCILLVQKKTDLSIEQKKYLLQRFERHFQRYLYVYNQKAAHNVIVIDEDELKGTKDDPLEID